MPGDASLDNISDVSAQRRARELRSLVQGLRRSIDAVGDPVKPEPSFNLKDLHSSSGEIRVPELVSTGGQGASPPMSRDFTVRTVEIRPGDQDGLITDDVVSARKERLQLILAAIDEMNAEIIELADFLNHDSLAQVPRTGEVRTLLKGITARNNALRSRAYALM